MTKAQESVSVQGTDMGIKTQIQCPNVWVGVRAREVGQWIVRQGQTNIKADLD